MLASPQFGIHIPFWVMLFLASGVAAIFGILLGAPTLRLRGDYLAIVTLGFGEIVPQTFLNLSQWTGRPQRHRFARSAHDRHPAARQLSFRF